MAYDFNGTSQYLSTASAPVSGPPLTIACWALPDGTSAGAYVAVGDSTSAQRYQLQQGFGNVNSVSILSVGSGIVAATTSTGVAGGTWHHAAGIVDSNSSRTIYLNGSNSVTDTNTMAVATPNSVVVGARFSPSIGFYFGGNLAEVGIWNAALTAAEIASLAKGMTCDKVRPQSLVFYAPLIRNLQDVRGGLAITNNNTATVANHPRVYA
jgi:hypothetical protein